MRISAMTENIKHRLVGSDAEITEIAYDSRKVKPGMLFCCINGTYKDGHEYAESAVNAGAAALLVERELPFDVPQIIVENSRVAMAEIAENFFGHPLEGIPVVGITGTNGKTTTTYMIKAICEKAGMKVGLIGTIRNLIGDHIIQTELTTPESVELQRVFRMMKDAGVDIIIMEVSSSALDQDRVHGIDFIVGGFTNLTQDHLDYHKTFENYLEAKKILFKRSKFAVMNADDIHSDMLLDGLNLPALRYGVRTNTADIRATNIDICPTYVEFDMNCTYGMQHITVPIPGLFNVFNAMLASGVCLKLGIGLQDIADGLASVVSVSGRMETLPTDGFDFSVILDFAHTPDGLDNLLSSVREFAKGRIITVFGCGGDRDNSKRPIMGETAARLSDLCVVTSDNPRTEDPMRIISMVLEGVERTSCEHVVIENRREAIQYALGAAKKDDIIVLAGKGHEYYQDIKGVKYPFDEKLIVAELLEEMRESRK